MSDSVSDSAGAGPDLKLGRRRKAATTNFRVDRLPPHSLEAEQGVLGCILLSPNDCLSQCIAKLESKESLYDIRHQTLYETLVEMCDNREAIDIITLQQRLKDKKLLDEIGGIPYLNALQDAVPSAANLSYYLDIVLEKHQLRRVVQTCTDVVGRVYDYEGEVPELMDGIERDILALRNGYGEDDRKPIKELVHSATQTIDDFHKRSGVVSGLSTGFADLDKMTDGLHPGEMVVIAARPSKGKTSLCMNIVEHVAVHLKLPVAVFSLEMTAESLVLREICSLARVNIRNIKEGFLAEKDFPKLTAAAGKVSASPLYIDDTSGLSIMQLRARARRLWQEFGIKLFVIDYLQLLHSTSARSRENRVQEIADISGGIKALAKELGVPVIVVSQLNRELEREKGRKPRLSDLRESGAIEQDADVVGLLYRPQVDDEECDIEQDGLAINLLIAKQRNGPTGDVNLTFLKSYTRFESAAKVSDSDEPEDQQTFPDP